MREVNDTSAMGRSFGRTTVLRAGATLALLLIAGSVGASVMGAVMGMAPGFVLCRNESTGQQVAVPYSDEAWDCEALGLLIDPGDIVLTGVRGVAIPYAQDEAEAPISDVEVSVHPKVSTVLVVTWNQKVAAQGGWIEFRIDGGEPMMSPERELAAGRHREFVFGAPADALVELRIANRFGNKIARSAENYSAMTGSLPEGISEPMLRAYEPSLALDADYLLTSLNTSGERIGWALILDRQGRIVWYQEPIQNYTLLVPRIAKSGDHIILDKDVYWAGGDDVSTLRRMTLDHRIIEEIPVPFLHHGWDERTDGTIVWGANESGFNDEELWAVDPDGNYRKVWDSDTWDVPGLIATNTTIWEESSDTVLLTFWTNSSTIEIDFQTGEIIRTFGDVEGSWAFDPPESKFVFAHGNGYTDDHTLLVSSHLPGGENEQRIREYQLDEDNETLIEIWNYGEGTGLYAPTWGEAIRLENGNTTLNTGSDPLIREVTNAGETAWEVEWNGFSTVGHMTYIKDLAGLYALNEGP